VLKLQFVDEAGKSLWLVGETLRIGTHPDNRLRLAGRGVREFHAQIDINGEKLLLRSTAGSCFVNGLPVDSEHWLQIGDELRIGDERLLVVDPKQIFAQEFVASAAPTGELLWILQLAHPQLRDKCISVRVPLRIGRGDDCDVVIPYKQLSLQHAELIPRHDGLLVRDLDSEQGTYLNGSRIVEALAIAGDRIQFARLPFTVLGADERGAAASSSRVA
jgi:pSer/pThr/pTyr-binding forkhead associated (FHA) protein